MYLDLDIFEHNYLTSLSQETDSVLLHTNLETTTNWINSIRVKRLAISFPFSMSITALKEKIPNYSLDLATVYLYTSKSNGFKADISAEIENQDTLYNYDKVYRLVLKNYIDHFDTLLDLLKVKEGVIDEEVDLAVMWYEDKLKDCLIVEELFEEALKRHSPDILHKEYIAISKKAIEHLLESMLFYIKQPKAHIK